MSLGMAPSQPAAEGGEIYGVPGSGWSSPDWNWGYASGTGHDCAAICRARWGTEEARAALVDALLKSSSSSLVLDADADTDTDTDSAAIPDAALDPPFEEVKLILALAWQRGRWDGTDGGRGGYGAVLSAMASADRYEPSSNPDRSRALIGDMKSRFRFLGPSEAESAEMDGVDPEGDGDLDAARRKCAGLVLRAMGFVRNGL